MISRTVALFLHLRLLKIYIDNWWWVLCSEFRALYLFLLLPSVNNLCSFFFIFHIECEQTNTFSRSYSLHMHSERERESELNRQNTKREKKKSYWSRTENIHYMAMSICMIRFTQTGLAVRIRLFVQYIRKRFVRVCLRVRLYYSTLFCSIWHAITKVNYEISICFFIHSLSCVGIKIWLQV